MSGLLLLMIFVLLAIAGAMFAYNIMPDFQKLNLARRFEDQLGAGREPPGLFKMLRLPILIFEDFASQLHIPATRERYAANLKSLGLEQLVTVDQLIALRITLFIVMCLYGVMMIPMMPVFVLVLPLFGWFFVDIWLKDKIAERKNKVKAQLPFLLDTLTLAVEAGLEFTAGINRIVQKMRPSPLREELMIFLRQMQLGTSRKEALKNLAERNDIREVNSMVSALIQASDMGASIGGALRTQSEIMSSERFTDAEKKGAEASQKMLVPMMLFIVPAIMLVVLGPILVNWVYGGF